MFIIINKYIFICDKVLRDKLQKNCMLVIYLGKFYLCWKSECGIFDNKMGAFARKRDQHISSTHDRKGIEEYN